MLRNATLVTLCALIVAAAVPSRAEPAAKHSMHVLRRVVLDPGHGGENTGCMGFHGVFEKFLTLQIALAVKARLTELSDAEVFLTRQHDEDFGLRERAQYATAVKGDVLVSIHLNASLGGTAHGVETYFLSVSSASDEIAALVAREETEAEVPIGATPQDVHRAALESILLDAQLGAAHQLSELLAATVQQTMVRALTPVADRGVKQAPFAVLKEATVPAIVVECGFLTNESEGTKLLLEEHHARIARALADALIAFDKQLAPRDSTVKSKGSGGVRGHAATDPRAAETPAPGG
jgi:N-acetylmuramoyl-L-alanine amidase